MTTNFPPTAILCPIDFSEPSRRAFDRAQGLAERHDARLTVLHVLPVEAMVPFTDEVPAAWSAGVTDHERARATSQVARFVGAPGTAAHTLEVVVRKGLVVSEILDQAREADLLVVGAHGRSGFDRLVLGSVTEKLLRKAMCPVLTVPAHAPPGAADVTHVMCPIDFSDCSLRALDHAMAIAQDAGARLTVLHVLSHDPDDAPADIRDTLLADTRLTQGDFRTQLETLTRARLEAAVPGAVRAYCRVDTVLAGGKPHQQILRLAHEQGADLIVMGVHGRGAAELVFLGSATQRVVRQAECPVLTMRAV